MCSCGCRYRANAQTTFFCLVDGPRSRLLRPWSRVPGARCGHVALSLNCKDLVPNGALSAIHCKPTRCTVPSRRNLAKIWPEFPRVALIARGLTSFLGGHFSRIIDAWWHARSVDPVQRASARASERDTHGTARMINPIKSTESWSSRSSRSKTPVHTVQPVHGPITRAPGAQVFGPTGPLDRSPGSLRRALDTIIHWTVMNYWH